MIAAIGSLKPPDRREDREAKHKQCDEGHEGDEFNDRPSENWLRGKPPVRIVGVPRPFKIVSHGVCPRELRTQCSRIVLSEYALDEQVLADNQTFNASHSDGMSGESVVAGWSSSHPGGCSAHRHTSMVGADNRLALGELTQIVLTT